MRQLQCHPWNSEVMKKQQLSPELQRDGAGGIKISEGSGNGKEARQRMGMQKETLMLWWERG